MAHLIAPARDVLYLGRGPDYPMALEGALKLKEISYIHAEGYAAGEMKHGPIALIDDKVPVIVLAPSGPLFEKTVSNMQEVRARGGKIVLISDAEGIAEAGEGCMATIEMPQGPPADRAAGLCGAGAAARLSRRGAEGHGRRPAAQPGEERDGRIITRPPAQNSWICQTVDLSLRRGVGRDVMRLRSRCEGDEPSGVAADLAHYWRDGYAIVRGFFEPCGNRAKSSAATGPALRRRRRARPLLSARQPLLQCRARAATASRWCGWSNGRPITSRCSTRVRLDPRFAELLEPLIGAQPQADHQPGPLEGAGLARRLRLAPGQPLPAARVGLSQSRRPPMSRPASRSIRIGPKSGGMRFIPRSHLRGDLRHGLLEARARRRDDGRRRWTR